ILQLLIEHRCRVVAKDEIMDRVWPGTFVEDNNLAVQISALRRILAVEEGGAQWIVTVSGRGYRFAGQIAETAPAAAAPPAASPVSVKGRPRWIVPAGFVVIVAAVLVAGFFSRPLFI